MEASTQTVLITGAAGFLGSAVATALLQRGHTVLALDTDHGQGRLDDHPHLTKVEADVRDATLIDRWVARCDRVIHFAAIAGVHTYIERTLDVLDTNILGTRNVLLAAARHGRPTLFASSSEAYGNHPFPLHEDAGTRMGPPTQARWCYATSKLAGEHYAWALARQGLPIAAVRYFNVYGPRLDAPGSGRVISQFLGAMQRQEPLTLVDGGHAVRCFCFIDDAVEATIALAMAVDTNPAVAGRPFNIGMATPISMAELARHMIRLAGYPHGTQDVAGTHFFGAGFEDIDHRVPVTTAIEEAIGWRATVPLEQGLSATLAHWDLLHDQPAPASPPEIPVIRPVYDADPALLDAMHDALRRGHTTNHGRQVAALEQEAADWLGVEEALTVRSGASGLEIAVRALRRGTKAALPSFTYIATLNAVELAGLEPVFVDIDPDTWTMCPTDLARVLRDAAVGVVLPVCAYGVLPDLDAIVTLAHEHGAHVVYDAAHALGSTREDARFVHGPDATVYSLHATKVLPATEGGLVIPGTSSLTGELAALRTHGLTPDPLDARTGTNAKMDELAAATARHGLAQLDGILARRRAYGDRLTESLARNPAFVVQQHPDGQRSNYQNLCARVTGSREAMSAHLAHLGIGWRRYFHPPLHHLRRLQPGPSLPVTDAVAASLMCLPLHSRMDEPTLARLEDALARGPHD